MQFKWIHEGPIYQAMVKDHGGFTAIKRRLPYLAERNIKTIWLCGVQENHNGVSPFALTDPLAVEKKYGTEDDLRDLINTGHEKHGFRFIGDSILNHVSRSSALLRSHSDWFLRYPSGWIRYGTDLNNESVDKPFVPGKDCWRFEDTAQFDFLAPGLKQYLIDSGYFMLNLGFDGLRMDAPMALLKNRMKYNWYRGREHEVDKVFRDELLREFIYLMRERRNDACFVAESFQMHKEMISCGIDVAYDPGCVYKAYDVFKRLADVETFDRYLSDICSNGGESSFCMAHFKDGHDIRDTRCNDEGMKKPRNLDPAELKVVATLIATMPGVPMLFNGELEAVRGYGYDREGTSFIDFGNIDGDLASFNYALSKLWRMPLFRQGGTDYLPTRDGWTSGGIRAFARQFNGEKAVVAVNMHSDYAWTAYRSFGVDPLLWGLGDGRKIMVRDMMTGQLFHETSAGDLRTNGLKVGLWPKGSQVLQLIPKD
ncbi:MAG: alpha-amylase family glycosyl hydrolase [Candidatus Saganbacteria bacterium]|nr:alpha-amylase family glycosyl hydrolase [Candidatus Saganbacteria bacterium]